MQGTKMYKSIALVHELQRRMIYISILALLALALMYVYFVGTAIVDTVVHKELRNEIAILNTHIADLEADYLHDKNTITKDVAISNGFTDLNSKKFVTRDIHVGRAY